jgi:COP9 signalosome complex subunit 3
MERCVWTWVHKKLCRDDIVYKTLPLPKYTHQTVSNLKGTSYHSLARVYPNLEQVHTIATKDRTTFIAVSEVLYGGICLQLSLFLVQDDNYGLLRLVVERAPRWAIRKLTETYLTLSLPEIGRAAGIEEVAEVRRVVVSMVRICRYRPMSAPARVLIRFCTDRDGRN